MAFEDLPKFTSKEIKSEEALQKLEWELVRAIDRIEKEMDYKFLPYEIDLMLLKRIKLNHERYMGTEFNRDK